MRCPKCDADNRDRARFCATCGSPLLETEAAPAAEALLPEEAAATDRAEDAAAVARPDAPAPLADEEAEPAAVEPVGAEGAEVVASRTGDTAGPDEVAGETQDEESPSPLPAGTLLADRYEIVELMSSGSPGNLYSALDLARCAVCGFDGNAPGDEYCADCGAALSTPPACQIREQPALEEPAAVAQFAANGKTYVVLAGEPAAARPASPQPIRLRWASQTHPGQVRELNEDRIAVHVYTREGGPNLGLFVVADGVGGQMAGEVASQLTTEVIWETIRQSVWMAEFQGEPVLPETMAMRVAEAVQAANQAVYRQRTAQGSDMGTTVTLALLRDNVAVIANVGDSRTYLWNAGGLQQLTVDHSLVQSLVEAGELEPEEIYSHPQRNIIYRSIGDRPGIEIDSFVREVWPGDRLLLCSDGLWEMARTDGIEEILLSEPVPGPACDALVELANLAGGTDNISVIIVEVEGPPSRTR